MERDRESEDQKEIGFSGFNKGGGGGGMKGL